MRVAAAPDSHSRRGGWRRRGGEGPLLLFLLVEALGAQGFVVYQPPSVSLKPQSRGCARPSLFLGGESSWRRHQSGGILPAPVPARCSPPPVPISHLYRSSRTALAESAVALPHPSADESTKTWLHTTMETTRGVAPYLTLGALLTYWGQTSSVALFGDPLLARVTWSAAVSLLGSFLAPAAAPAIACGSYLGMCSTTVIPSLAWMAAASLVASIVYALEVHHIKAAENMGGRLGAVALVSAVVTYLVKFLMMGGEPQWHLHNVLVSRPLYNPHHAIVEMLASGVAAAATIWTRQRVLLLSMPARAASVIGLVGSLLLPLMVEGSNLSIAFYGGGFVGMTDPRIFGKPPGSRMRRVVRSYAVAGALGACCNAILHCLLVGGWGGKLGMTALLGVASLKVLRR